MQEAIRDDAPLVDEPWRTPLDELERTLKEVGRALSELRTSLESGHDVGARPVVQPTSAGDDVQLMPAVDDVQPVPAGDDVQPMPAVDDVQPVPAVDDVQPMPAVDEPEITVDAKPTPANFEAVWGRIEEERKQGGGSEPANVDIEEPPTFSEPPQPTSDPPRLTPAFGQGLSEEAEEVGKSRLSSFEGVWERLERERKERSDSDVEDVAEVRGLGHLPQTYRITVEDRDGTPVDLVTIHRALLTFTAADNISLINFANGVPIVSVKVHGDLDKERLATTIGAATSRHCEVITQDNGKLFLRLSSEEGTED